MVTVVVVWNEPSCLRCASSSWARSEFCCSCVHGSQGLFDITISWFFSAHGRICETGRFLLFPHLLSNKTRFWSPQDPGARVVGDVEADLLAHEAARLRGELAVRALATQHTREAR